MANLSPMMQQYVEMKEKNPGTILFFRLGDFYEMFFDDAKLVSQELDLTLTGIGQARHYPCHHARHRSGKQHAGRDKEQLHLLHLYRRGTGGLLLCRYLHG